MDDQKPDQQAPQNPSELYPNPTRGNLGEAPDVEIIPSFTNNPAVVIGQQQNSFQLTTPPTSPKSNKKLIIIIAASVTALLILLTVVAVLMPKGKKTAVNPLPEIYRSYDSPFGILPAFQEQAIRNGKFKLKASYVTGADFTREGNFYIEPSGAVNFETLPDVTTVNGLVKTAYLKHSSEATYAELTHGATQNFKYDFNSLLNYAQMYDKNAVVFGGFIPLVESAQVDPKTAENKLLKPGPLCDTALTSVKKKTAANIHTNAIKFERRRDGIKTFAKVEHASLLSIDAVVIDFLETCFDLAQPAAAPYRAYVEKLKEEATKSPEFSYWQDGSKFFFEVGLPHDKTELTSSLLFELSDLNSLKTSQTGASAAFNEHRNLFGLAYSVCRTAPVVTLSAPPAYTYRFLIEDTAYPYPSQRDAGYYCSTLAVPIQYIAAQPMNVKPGSSPEIKVAPADTDKLRAAHDLRYLIERFNRDNKRYPNQAEFNDLTGNNLAGLSAITQSLVKAKTLTYTFLPAGCTNECKDYILAYNFGQQAQLLGRPYGL